MELIRGGREDGGGRGEREANGFVLWSLSFYFFMPGAVRCETLGLVEPVIIN